MRLILKVLVFILWFPVWAQSSIIDDLRAQLNDSLTDSAEVMVKTQLARELVYIDNAEAYQLVQEALNIANEHDLELEGAYALRILGAVMREYGFYLKGSEIVLDAKAIFEDYGDEVGVANCYLSLGNFYNYLSNQELAIESERKAVKIFERLNISERLGVIYNNFGRTFCDVGQYDSAIYYCRKSIEVNTAISNFPLIQSNYRNLGLIFLAQNQSDSAKRAFNRVLNLHQNQGDYSNKWAVAEAYLGLAKVALKDGETEQITDHIKQARDLCVQYGYLNILKEVIQTAFDYYHSFEHYNEIDQLWLTYENLTDSLLLIERDNKKYIVDWYEERIQKDSEIAEFTSQLGKQKVQIIVLLITIFFVLVILVMFLSNIRRARKTNKVLKAQKLELEKLNQTKSKLFSIVAHDFISPLSNVYSFSRLLVENRQIDPEDQKLIVQELNQSVENTIGLTKNLLTWARGQMEGEVFNPLNVEVGQLMKYVIQSISSQSKAKQIEIVLEQIEPVTIYGDPAHLEVVFRNLISNAIKFSHPQQKVRVIIENLEKRCEIKVIDNGVGMSQEVMASLYELKEYHDTRGTSGEKGTGLGLIICREFVEKNFGTIQIDSETEKGTTFILSFPSV